MTTGNGTPRAKLWEWITGIAATLVVVTGGAIIANHSTDNVQTERITTNRAGLHEVRGKVEKIEKALGENALRDLKTSIETLRSEFRADMKEVRGRLREIEARLPPK